MPSDSSSSRQSFYYTHTDYSALLGPNISKIPDLEIAIFPLDIHMTT